MATKVVKTMKEFDAMLTASSYSREFSDGHFEGWDVKRLWKLAEKERVKTVLLAQFQLIIDKWMNFDSKTEPDGRVVVPFDVDHFLRIRNANLKFPILLETNGLWVMDGMHRLMKCYLANIEHIKVVQFAMTPEPDVIYYPKNKVQMW